MAKKIDEEKLAEFLSEITSNHWFNPVLAAHLIVNYPIYTQDRIMELMSEIIKAQAGRYAHELEHDQTSAGLMLASHLAEVIDMHAPIV